MGKHTSYRYQYQDECKADLFLKIQKSRPNPSRQQSHARHSRVLQHLKSIYPSHHLPKLHIKLTPPPKNEMIVPPSEMTRSWPTPVLSNRDLFSSYSRSAHSIGLQILHILALKLGIDPEEISSRHALEKWAGDHIRMTRGPPRKEAKLPEIQTPSHTDFGSITVLMNWLGGLQVWSSPNRTVGNLSFDDSNAKDSEGTWLWVKPKAGCAIINLG